MYSKTGPGSASQAIEFEFTRTRHLKDKRAKETVTSMFKGPPEGLIAQAWRLLLAATKDKLLLPVHAQRYRDKHVARWEGEEPAISAPLAQSARNAARAFPLHLQRPPPGHPPGHFAEKMARTTFPSSQGWTEHWFESSSCGYFWNKQNQISQWSIDVPPTGESLH